MKKLLKSLAFLAVATIAGTAWADSWGYYGSDRSWIGIDAGAGSVAYSLDGSGSPSFQGADLGEIAQGDSLTIVSYDAKTWKHGADISACQYYYKINDGEDVSMGGGWMADIGWDGDQKWGNDSVNADVAAGLAPGTYTLSVHGKITGSTDPVGDMWEPGETTYYSATFTIAASTVTFTVTVPEHTVVTVTGATSAGGNTYQTESGTEVTIKYAADGAYVATGTKSQKVTPANGDTIAAPADYATTPATVEYTSASGAVTYYVASGLGTLNTGTYKLLDEVTRDARMAFGNWANSVTFDLNGHTLTSSASDCAFTLGRNGTAAAPKTFSLVDTSAAQGGSLVFTTAPSSSTEAIRVAGNYNQVTIGEGVTVSGGSIGMLGANQTLTVNGTVAGGDDFAIVSNGESTQNLTLTVADGSVITSDTTAIYLPGTGTATIAGSVTGATGIEIRSGSLEIVDGAEITATGAFSEEANGNGPTVTGAAVAVSQHTTKNPIDVTVSGGTLSGAKALYETDIQNGDETTDVAMAITGGEFAGAVESDDVAAFISGGTFDAEVPAEYCAAGFAPAYDEESGTYVVEPATTLTVTFDPNGGQIVLGDSTTGYTRLPFGETINKTYEIGGNYDELASAALAGYARSGWFTEREGGSPVLVGDEVLATDATTLYAQWTTDQILTFDAQGGDCVEQTRTCTVGEKYGKLPTPTKAGNAFVGWFTAAENGRKLGASSIVIAWPARTIYAYWTDKQTVTFDTHGGDAIDPQDFAIGGKYGKLPKPTWAGHVFLGWYTDAENGRKLGAGSVVTAKATRTMHAYWTDEQVVTFDAHGGTCDPETKTYTIGDKYGKLPVPTWADHEFLGWYTDAVNGRKLGPGSIVTAKAERTMHAYWAEAVAAAASRTRATPRAGTATLPVDEEYTATQSWTALTGFSGNGVGTYADGRCKFDSNSDWLMVQFDSAPGTLTFDVKGNTSSSGTAPGSFLVEESANGSDWDEVVNLPSSSFNDSSYTHFGPYTLDSASRYVRWTYAQKYGFNLGLNNVHITAGSASEPTVTVQATATEIEEGQSVTVTASASGFSDNDSVKWVWFLGETQQAETSATLSLNNLAEGTYQVTAWGYLGDDLATATEKDDDIVTITVNPASVYYTITVDDQIENGTIEADKASAQDGETVTLTAHPDDGYALDKFYVDGTEIPGNTFQIQGADVTVSATFKVKTSYTAIYTVTSKTAVSATGDVPDGSSATYSQTYNSTAGQATKTNSLSLVLKGYEGLKIVGLTLSMHSNGSSGAGTLSVTSGTDTIASIANAGFGDDSWHGSYINTWVDVTPAVTQTVVDDDVVFLITATTNSLFCQSYSVEYEFVPAEPSVTLTPSVAEVFVGDELTITATAENFSGPVTWEWTADSGVQDGASFAVDTTTAGEYLIIAEATCGDEYAYAEANVTVKAPSTPHAIEIETDGNGTLTADPNPAMEGVTVTLTAVPNEGYRLDYVESDEVTITDMQFVMPDNAVGVYAFFEGKHDVVIDDEIVNGSVEASPATAFSDETVTLTVLPDAGYKLDTLTVLDEDANEIPVTDMSFVMPKGDAYVFATFVELADMYFQFETADMGSSYTNTSAVLLNTGSTAETIPTVAFSISRTVRGTGPTDKKVGAASMRMAPLKDDDAVVVNAAAFENDISKVSFRYAIFGNDNIDSVIVQVSADGDDWEELVDLSGATTNLQTYVSESVDSGMKFIRFVATNPGTSNNHRFNVDEIQLWFADARTLTVTFDPNGGQIVLGDRTTGYTRLPFGETITKTYQIGGTYEELASAALAGYARSGWYTAREGGSLVSIGDDVTADDATTLYAQWTTEQILTFDAQGGSCDEPTRLCTVGEKYGKLPTPTKAGNAFLGWYTDAENGRKLGASSIVIAWPARTIYAYWTDMQTVTFDTHGGPDIDPQEFAIGGKYGPLPKPTWAGHVFLGWYTTAENGRKLGAGSVVTEKATRTMHAYWTDEQVVTFDAHGGTCDPETKTYTIGGKYGKLPVPTWDGHEFLGWYTDAENGRKLGAGSIVTAKAERTMHAYWSDENAQAGTTGLTISGFSMKKAGAPAARDARGTAESSLTFEAVAGRTYEIQWTLSLDGEWTVVKTLTAAEDGDTVVTFAVPSGSAAGFARVVAK